MTQKSNEDDVIEIQSRSISDPTPSDIDLKMAFAPTQGKEMISTPGLSLILHSDVITKLVMENVTFDELNYPSQEEFLSLHSE